MKKLIAILCLLVFCLCGINPSAPDSTGTGKTMVSVIINFRADPPDGMPEQCYIYSNGMNVKTFLYNGIDTISVADGADLRAEYYKKYVPYGALLDTVASAWMIWEIR